MSITVAIQFVALVVIAAIGVCVVYLIFEMREVYAEQRSKFIRAIQFEDSEQFLAVQKLLIVPEFIPLRKNTSGRTA